MMSDKTKQKRVHFRLFKPDAKEVVLVGSWNQWESPGRELKKDKNGTWRTWILIAFGQYEYRYRVDGCWENDPSAKTVPNSYGTENSVLVVD